MSIFLEITQLENGDVVLREAGGADAEDRGNPVAPDEDGTIVVQRASSEPLVRIRFSREVNDMLGEDAVGVAEAMIDAATEYLDGLGDSLTEEDVIEEDVVEEEEPPESEMAPPVVH